jgi:hypothetical protein
MPAPKYAKNLRALRQLKTPLLGYSLLLLTSCQNLPEVPPSHTPSSTARETPFPDILTSLEEAPPFGNPALYKKWKKTRPTTRK